MQRSQIGSQHEVKNRLADEEEKNRILWGQIGELKNQLQNWEILSKNKMTL